MKVQKINKDVNESTIRVQLVIEYIRAIEGNDSEVLFSCKASRVMEKVMVLWSL